MNMNFGLVFISLIVAANATTRPTVRPTPATRPPIDPNDRRILPPWLCHLPPVCTDSSPRVCGRNPSGQCERYRNICELLDENRRNVNVGVVHVRDIECRAVRGLGGANRRPCYRPCPSRPVVCKRTPVSQEICVRSRNNRECKILANRCQLRNQNCHSRPRNNWLRTDRRRCGKLILGDKPQPCIPLPRPSPRPITRTPSPITRTPPPITRTPPPITISPIVTATILA